MKYKIIIILMFVLLLVGCKNSESIKDNNNYSIGDIEEFASGFHGADGITIDNNGRMYVGNRQNNKIVYVDSTGMVHDFVTVPCIELLILTTDNIGNIYAAGTDKVFKISPEGNIEVIASNFGCADDLVLDKNGNLYVTDSKRNIIYKINSNHEKSVFIDNNYSGNLTKWFITGITFDVNYENLYVVRMDRGEILKYPIDENGDHGEEEIIITGLVKPDHITVDKNNNLYVTLFSKGALIKISPDYSLETICNRTMVYATGIALGKGDLDEHFAYIADYSKNKVYKIYIG